jgi:excisionase family DNA binding protein
MTQKSQPEPKAIPAGLRLYTTTEAAAILNVSLRTLQSWVKDGTLPHVRLGKSGRLVRIRAQDMTQLIQRNYQQRPPK